MKPVLPVSLRTFLLVFLPMSVALVAGFIHLQRGTESELRRELRSTLATAEKAQAEEWRQFRTRHRRLLGSVAENSALKAGLALWNAGEHSAEARRTIEDQLTRAGRLLGYEVLALRDASQNSVAGVRLIGAQTQALHPDQVTGMLDGITQFDGAIYETLSAPINTDAENLGFLIVGQPFELNETFGPAVLVSKGKVIRSSVRHATAPGLEEALTQCGGMTGECEARVNGETFLVMRPDKQPFGDDYAVYTFHSVDAASAGVVGSARRAFRVSLVATLIVAVLVSLWATRSLIRPLTNFVERLRASEESGLLRSDFPTDSGTREINELARAFNHAAAAIADSQRKLDQAYIEFTKTMAQTLDARDPYTAGHSSRVSAYAVATAEAMNLPKDQIEIIRIGANLHDIGKIGVPDDVLQKPGKLNAEELEAIRKHPVIGRKILEGVSKFGAYLDIVELHHENHDGTGYPLGLRETGVPLGARIVHVVDAYDAMTTNRPYRKAMTPAEASAILDRYAGSMFDPEVVHIFLRVVNPETVVRAEDSVKDLAALSREVGQPGLETVGTRN